MAKNKNEIIEPLAQEGDLNALLIKLRESIGYTTAQVAEAMCLSEETIGKLENEDFEHLAEPPYIRGYLRNYAKLAETDADELINCYESLRGADPSDLNYHFKKSAKIHSHRNKKASPIILQLLSLAVLIALIAGISMIPAVNQWAKETWNSFSTQTSSQSTNNTDNPLLTGTMPVPTPLPFDIASSEKENEKKLAPVAAPNTNTEDDTRKEVSADSANEKPTGNKELATTKKPTTTEDDSVESIKVGDKTEQKSEALIPTNNSDTIKIKLVFNKEIWMRIRDGKKKTVFEGQNASGQEKVLNLKKPLTFRVGNAQGLSLFVDGNAVDISRYIKGSIANFTLE